MKNLQKKEKFWRVYIMQIDYALILSAGLGTRMGAIGKKIPKVLWPLYFKTLLELQIRYCQERGVKKIYINTHFLHDEIVKFLENSKLQGLVTILYEDPLLDSGGAIHNLANRAEINYNGNLLLVNGDQFLFFNDDYWRQAQQEIANCRAVLFGIKVSKNSSYNETVLSGSKLVDIQKNTGDQEEYTTYSGLGLLNLNGLLPVQGISKFFDTVANYKNENIQLVSPANFEYWDFGTAEIYAKNVFKLANKSESEMLSFLYRHDAFNGKESLFLNKTLLSIDLEYKGRFSPNTIQALGQVQNF
jgi:choline kinase